MTDKSKFLFNFSKIKSGKHKSFAIWLTGLSGSGKSAIAYNLKKMLQGRGFPACIIDGDRLRETLSSDLGFSIKDRKENIRRAAAVAKMLIDNGIIAIVSLISPFKNDRNAAKRFISAGLFIEVFVNCPLSECEKRDTRGLYKKARAGKIKNFTGISSPYQKPDNPQITVNTDKESVNSSCEKIIHCLLKSKPI